MKNFVRSNQFLSLCGLNCGLCPMKLGNHCGGCGKGNQSYRIAKCSMEQHVEYCFECDKYPCDKYNEINHYDSFITHENQLNNLCRAKLIGAEQYNKEQIEKVKILQILLNRFNNGKRKNFYCIAVNLLDLNDLNEIFQLISTNEEFNNLSENNQCEYVYHMFKNKEIEKNIKFKLRRKPKS